MEWWVPLIILIAILGLVAITIIIVFAVSSNNSKGDYNDGGGKQYGVPGEPTVYMSSAEIAGVQGERTANFQIRKLLRQDEYLLSNVLLPLKNGKKTEIDSVIVSRKGIFCIETKNWAGRIYGNDEKEYWTQQYDDPYKIPRKHKNPVLQNEGHCAVLEKILNDRFRVEGAVVFINFAAEYYVKSFCFYTLAQFKNHYRELPDNELTIEEVKQIFQKLSRYIPSMEDLIKHKESIRNSDYYKSN